MLHLLLLATVLRTSVMDPTKNVPDTMSVRTVVGTATVSTHAGTKGPHRIEGMLLGGSTIATDGFITTSDKSGLVLDLPDGCSVWVGPNTRIDFSPPFSDSHNWTLNGGLIIAKISDAGAIHTFEVRTQIGDARIKHGAVRVAQHQLKTAIRNATLEVGVADGTCEYTAWARPTKDGEGLIKAGDEVVASISPQSLSGTVPGPNAIIHSLSPASETEIKEALKHLAR